MAKVAAKPDAPRDCWLKQKEMADALGISVQAFQKWGVDPVDRIGRCTYYLVRDVVANRVDHAMKFAPRSGAPNPDDDEFIDPIREKALLDRERRKGELLKNDERMGVVFPVDAAGFVIAKMGSEIAGILESLPGQIKIAVPTLTAKEIDDIKREIARVRNIAAAVGDSFDDYLETYLDTSETES